MMSLVALLSLFLAASSSARSQVLVVSFDGFRYNYLQKGASPFLQQLVEKCSRAEYLTNVFPTKTFPNHYTLATGLFPEVHGVLDGEMYDATTGKRIAYDQLFHYNEQVEPLWITNDESDPGGRHSGVMMWPAADVQFRGRLPTFHRSYNLTVPWKSRVDTVIDWFTHSTTPANLVFLYFEDPDRVSHVFGPESHEVLQQITRVDTITRYLYERLSETNLTDVVNVVLVSDHGMSTVTPDRIINLKQVLNEHSVQVVAASPVLHLFPPAGTDDTVYKELKNLSDNLEFSVYRDHDIPDRWHFKQNNRIPPMILVADEGFAFHDLAERESSYRLKWDIPASRKMTFGVHGYDPEVKDMHPFFMACGPQIKKNYIIKPFNTVDVYSLVSHLLKLEVPLTNGTLDNVIAMMSSCSLASPSSLWLMLLAVTYYGHEWKFEADPQLWGTQRGGETRQQSAVQGEE